MRSVAPAAAAEATAALGRRLAAIAPLLGVEPTGREPGSLLAALVDAVRADLRDDRVWLLHVALTTAYPDQDDVRRLRRGLVLRAGDEAERWLLEQTLGTARTAGVGAVDLRIVSRTVVVDVDFTARNPLNTGVQRVVRALLPRWDRDHDVVPVAWTATRGAYRPLSAAEEMRALRWGGDPYALDAAPPPDRPTVVVPWRSVVVLPEVTTPASAPRLAALAAMSGNEVALIGHDCIPLVSAQTLPRSEAERFAHHLSVVKYAARVAGVSASAAGEFAGFAHMLASQGLPGPAVTTVVEPVELPGAGTPSPRTDTDPLVLVVGTLDPRKNPGTVLYAAEVLWREGLAFRLQFVSGGGPTGAAGAEIERLARAGRRVAVARGVRDDELADLYDRARFTVFVSLHEGFGLPVAESLARGVPAIATRYGSVGETAAGGGALAVDPRDGEDLVAAMRALLVDDVLRDRLLDQIARRPPRTWDDYATELWQALVPA